jgi:hypothetical protein
MNLLAGLRWWNDWWSRRARWWKAFYYVFIGAAIFFMLQKGSTLESVILGAASLALWVAAGVWLSEKMKDRWGRNRDR